MAEVLIRLSFRAGDGPLIHSGAYRWILRALALWNYSMMPRWGLPPLYSSHVRYGIPATQEFPDALAIYEQGFADCGPLAAVRVAELWRAGERPKGLLGVVAPWIGGADFRIYSRPVQDGRRLFHAQVRRGPQAGLVDVDGKAVQQIEDPSRHLGMKAVT